MTLQERLDKMEPRERNLLYVLGGLVAAFVFLLIPIAVVSMVSSKQDENQELRDLISTIEDSKEKISAKKSERDALLARYAQKAPPVAGLIEEAARENGLSVAESQNKPDIPHGKRYTERVTVVKLRKIGMLGLAKTLEKIAQSPYPVAITKLSIRPRTGEPDSYEVQLGVSAYDRKEPEKKEADKPAAGEEEKETEE
jgi:general secretion pathway protein M